MNLSPSKQQTQNKPKVSFLYHNNSPALNKTPTALNKQNNIPYQAGQRSRSPIISKYHNKHIPVIRQCNTPIQNNRSIQMPVFLKQKNFNVTPFDSQSKYYDKPLSPNSAQRSDNNKSRSYVLPHLMYKNSSISSPLNTISKISQKSVQDSKISQCQQNLPQFNNSQEKSVNKDLQSFYTQKSSDNSPTEKCSRCNQKDAAYQITKTKIRLCAECGITELIKGSQLFEIKAKSSFCKSSQILSQNSLNSNSQSNNYSNHSNQRNCHIVKQPSRQIETEQFLSQVNSEKKSLLRLKQSFQNNQQSHISNFYKDKKYKLKQHYQKIKIAIKQSIQADLKQLQKLQEQQKWEWEQNLTKMKRDIEVLQNIENDLTYRWEKLINQRQIDQQKYLQIINKHRLNSSRITNCDQYGLAQASSSSMSIQKIEQNFSSLFCAKNTNKHQQLNLYDEKTYRMYFNSKNSDRSKSDVLFSFQNPKTNS